MHQCEINALASTYGLQPSRQHSGSDRRMRFFLTRDVPNSRFYFQAMVSYPEEDCGGEVWAHAGLYGDKKLADDGEVTYPSVAEAVANVVHRFDLLRRSQLEF